VISEQEFANLYSEFWRQLLPMGDEYVRARNRQLGRFGPPLVSGVAPQSRGTVNEFGFRLFAAGERLAIAIEDLPEAVISEAYGDATSYIFGKRDHLNDELETREAKLLAKRLAAFFEKANARPLTIFPPFRGCGVIEECAGDVVGGDALFEVKAGGRNFRSIDIRQVLVYCALNFASPMHSISRICLVNPRNGVFLEESIEQVCLETSGRSSPDVFSELIEFVSEQFGPY
jgi:hypothetical protein